MSRFGGRAPRARGDSDDESSPFFSPDDGSSASGSGESSSSEDSDGEIRGFGVGGRYPNRDRQTPGTGLRRRRARKAEERRLREERDAARRRRAAEARESHVDSLAAATSGRDDLDTIARSIVEAARAPTGPGERDFSKHMTVAVVAGRRFGDNLLVFWTRSSPGPFSRFVAAASYGSRLVDMKSSEKVYGQGSHVHAEMFALSHLLDCYGGAAVQGDEFQMGVSQEVCQRCSGVLALTGIRVTQVRGMSLSRWGPTNETKYLEAHGTFPDPDEQTLTQRPECKLGRRRSRGCCGGICAIQ